MIRKFRAETEDAERKAFTTEAGTPDGIEGQAGMMYIEYVTANGFKVLHQLRAVEEGSTTTERFDSAVKRLEATGFKRVNERLPGDSDWVDGETRAYIRFGSLDAARADIGREAGHRHEYSFLD
nr:MAG: hypothetical protein [Bacteriophage sp.]